MRGRRSALVVLGMLAVCPLVWAALRQVRQNEADSLFRKAATAYRRVAYQGTASWDRGGGPTTCTIRHDLKTGYTSYRWRRGWPVVLPRISTRSPDPAAFCLDLKAAQRNYRAEEAGEGSYLGRKTRVLVLHPRHPGRPTLRIDVEASDLLPLRVATRRFDGSRYRTAAFESLSALGGSVRAPAAKHAPDWFGTIVPSAGLDETVHFRVLRPAYLPSGFVLRETRVEHGCVLGARLSYTDGITVFEIREHPLITPARLAASLPPHLSQKKRDSIVRRYVRRHWNELVRSGEDPAVVKRHAGRTHDRYRFRVGDLEISLVARTDLDPAEIERVLRSLHP